MSRQIEEFRLAMLQVGVFPPDVIIPDGAIHRFSTNGKPSDRGGWYVLFDDGLPAGCFGDWRTNLHVSWCSREAVTMTHAEREKHHQRIQDIRAKRAAEISAAQEYAATYAEELWMGARPSLFSPYLSAKGVQPHGTRVNLAGTLLVPMRDTTGRLWNIERIGPEDFSSKRGLPGGRRTGCYFSIGHPSGVLVVCEGFATGASIHECTGYAVAVAFNAGNLLPVAEALSKKYPGVLIVLAADDDRRTPGNPGMTKATAAALAVGGLVAAPTFNGSDLVTNPTDFNDMHRLMGSQAVRAVFDRALSINTPNLKDFKHVAY